MKLTLGFSPCPNDTFIFDALVNNKIDTGGLEFDTVPEDVETLNQWSFEGKLDITKLSFPAFFRDSDKYILLNSGAALGKGVGPILISKFHPEHSEPNLIPNFRDQIENFSVTLPGENTTANLLFSFAYPEAKNKIFMRFDKIEDYVLSGSPQAPSIGGALGEVLGVIIHENRFTYQQKGLFKVLDLGEYWEEKMKTPVPLGGIAVKKSIGKKISLQIEKLIRKSLEYAFHNYPLITDYVKLHAQEMSEQVMRQHIELYVNNYSLNLGAEGKKAIETLYRIFLSIQSPPVIGLPSKNLFLS